MAVGLTGVEVAVVISMEYLPLLQNALKNALAYQEAEKLAARINWSRVAKTEAPAKWLEGEEPKPF